MVYKTSDDLCEYQSVMEALLGTREESYKACMENAMERLKLINQEIKYNAVDNQILGELEKLNNIFNREFSKKDRESEK